MKWWLVWNRDEGATAVEAGLAAKRIMARSADVAAELWGLDMLRPDDETEVMVASEDGSNPVLYDVEMELRVCASRAGRKRQPFSTEPTA